MLRPSKTTHVAGFRGHLPHFGLLFCVAAANFAATANRFLRVTAVMFVAFCKKAGLVLRRKCTFQIVLSFVLPQLQINFNLPLTLSIIYDKIGYIPMRCKMHVGRLWPFACARHFLEVVPDMKKLSLKLSLKATIILIVIAAAVLVLGILCIVAATASDPDRLNYVLDENEESYTISDIKNDFRGGWFCKDSLTIPATHNGKPINTLKRINSTHIKEIIISEGITEISGSAFASNTSLEKVVLPSTLQTIGSSAFLNCSSLKSITIPASVTSIGENAFNSCVALEEIVIESGNTEYAYVNNCLIEVFTGILMFGGKNASIPTDGSVTEIASSAFSGNTSITTITIPESITKIGNSAFKGCTNLTKVVWNAIACTKAGANNVQIFEQCSSLSTFVVGKDVTTIPAYTFDKLNGILQTVTFENTAGWVTKKDKNANPVALDVTAEDIALKLTNSYRTYILERA